MTIYTTLDGQGEGGRTVRTIFGHDMLLEHVPAELERLQDRIDFHLAALEREHNTAARRRLRAKVDKWTVEHDFLFRQANPPASNADDYVKSDIVNCRSASCTNQLDRKTVGFLTMNFCPPCARIAGLLPHDENERTY